MHEVALEELPKVVNVVRKWILAGCSVGIGLVIKGYTLIIRREAPRELKIDDVVPWPTFRSSAGSLDGPFAVWFPVYLSSVEAFGVHLVGTHHEASQDRVPKRQRLEWRDWRLR